MLNTPDGHHQPGARLPIAGATKTPVIYRAAAQWFIRMDEGEGVFTDPIPESPKRLCARSRWKPSSRPASTLKTVQDRLRAMIAGRPELVHLAPALVGRAHPFFLHVDTGAHPHHGDHRPGGRHDRARHQAWNVTTEEILGAEEARKTYTKSTDILEVWFGSGSTFWHVMRGTPWRPYTTRRTGQACTWKVTISTAAWVPLFAAAGLGHLWPRPGSKGLLTHGFRYGRSGARRCPVVINTVAPQDVNNKMGAEIIRLWVAATDYSGDPGHRRQDPGPRGGRLPPHHARCVSCWPTSATT